MKQKMLSNDSYENLHFNMTSLSIRISIVGHNFRTHKPRSDNNFTRFVCKLTHAYDVIYEPAQSPGRRVAVLQFSNRRS